MIQNYSKWEVIPPLQGRKYDKRHIAVLIVTILYKQVLSINRVKEGIVLQICLLGMKSFFDKFADSLDAALQHTFSPIENKECYQLSASEIHSESVGFQLVDNAFASKLLASLIITSKRYQNLGE